MLAFIGILHTHATVHHGLDACFPFGRVINGMEIIHVKDDVKQGFQMNLRM